MSLATDRLVAVGAIWIFLALVAAIGRHLHQRGERAGLSAVLAGVVAARIAYVAGHWASFADSPLSMLAVWQGGFSTWTGIVTVAAVLAFMLRGMRARALGLVTLAAVSAAGLAALALLTPAPRPLPYVAPLERLSGPALDLASLKGKQFVVNLWATWCPPCRRELPMLADEAGKHGLPILLVDQGEDAAKVGAFLASVNVKPDHVLLDPGATMSQAVGANGYPVTLFIDANGMIVQMHSGEIGRAGLLDGIELLEKDTR